jgi:osmotically-inducible protein OsmY
MKKSLAFALTLGLAACGGDKPKLAPAADAAAPKTAAAAPLPIATEPAKPNLDKELAQRVSRAIEEAKLHGIDVVATDGVVTLWGATPTAKQRERAAQAAAKVPGVKAVDNKLEVVTGS